MRLLPFLVFLALPALAVPQPAQTSGARLFAPGVIATAAFEFTPAFTPDGRTCYFLRFQPGMKHAAIFESHLRDGKWTRASMVPFSGSHPDGSPSLSPDGNTLFFSSRRPLPGQQAETWEWHIWYAQRNAGRWSEPRPVPPPVLDEKKSQTSPSVSLKGTLYFSQQGKSWDIYRSRLIDGAYTSPEPVRVNSGADETAASISADESFIVYASTGRAEGMGESDLYIDRNLNQRVGAGDSSLLESVNTARNESHPRLSPDGRTLYFTRDGDVYEIGLEAAQGPDARWSQKASMLNGRLWPQAVTARGKVYVYGGFSDSRQWVGTLEEYDPARDRWAKKADPPEGWSKASLAVSKDHVFLFRRGDAGLARYDASADRWIVLAVDGPGIPDGPEFQTRTVSTGDRVFTLKTGDAGPAAADSYACFAEFDFLRMAWVERAGMPFPAVQLVASGGLVYAFGGGARNNMVQVYDPAAERWIIRTGMPSGRHETALAALNRTIYAFGGHRVSGEPADPVDQYDFVADRWSALPSARFHRWAAAAVTLSGRILVIGGGAFEGPADKLKNAVYEFTPAAP